MVALLVRNPVDDRIRIHLAAAALVNALRQEHRSLSGAGGRASLCEPPYIHIPDSQIPIIDLPVDFTL